MINRDSQKGSALVYILIAIALLAALTATFMDSSSQQTSSQNAFNTVTELNSQINLIRSNIQECVLTYPAGEDGLTSTYNTPYPINPTSAHLTATVPATTNNNVANIRCPGNPGGASTNHAAMFGGSSGKFMPPKPNLFLDWKYYSGDDGVFFFTSTPKTDGFLKTALTKLDDQFSECEADLIDNAAGGTTLNITNIGGSGPNCPANSLCFRVWLIVRDPARTVTTYAGDTDNDEHLAGCWLP